MPYVVGDRRREGRMELQAAFENPQDYPATNRRCEWLSNHKNIYWP